VGEIRTGDPAAAFVDLPPGVRLRDDPRPQAEPVMAPRVPTQPKQRHRRRRR
jgi:hypothetical protein